MTCNLIIVEKRTYDLELLGSTASVLLRCRVIPPHMLRNTRRVLKRSKRAEGASAVFALLEAIDFTC